MFIYVINTLFLKEVNVMGAYLVLYFLSLILSLLFYYLSKKKKEKSFGDISSFFLVLMIFFFILALATGDPIERFLTTIPAFWQFMITALGGSFAIYKVYLNPLKQKVYSIDNEVGNVKTDITTIKENVGWIREELVKLMKKKK